MADLGDLTHPLHDVILDRAAAQPDHPALVFGEAGQTTTYAQLAADVTAIAAALRARGAQPGEVVAIWMPNVPAWVATALGAMRAGLAVTGISPAAVEREVAFQLHDSGARFLVSFAPFAAVAQAAATGTAVEEVITFGDAEGTTPYSALVAHADDGTPSAPGGDALALLPYSSGTTGLPKGVELTHRNIAAAVAQFRERETVRAGDVVFAVPPYSHILGATLAMLVPLAEGATVVTIAKPELEPFFGVIDRFAVTTVVIPPPLAAALAHHPLTREHDLGTLHTIACGGAPLSPALQQALAERFPEAVVGQGWAMTETTGALTIPERPAGARPGTVGRVAAGTELRVVDPATGEDVPAGEDGELLVRGPQVMRGYRARGQETAAAIDADGWLRTGDLGHVDDDGAVVIVDRIKELIKVNAYQVAPAELEAVLASHPAVADAAVVGRPDERRGEVPVAFVALRGEVAPAELAQWLGERVAPYKRPAEVVVVDEIPRSMAGKLLRRELREGALAAAG